MQGWTVTNIYFKKRIFKKEESATTFERQADYVSALFAYRYHPINRAFGQGERIRLKTTSLDVSYIILPMIRATSYLLSTGKVV